MGKTIVLSDVHMSNGAKYSGFKDVLEDKLVQFLTKLVDDPSVSQIVFLGDLFDTWLYPIDVVPFTYKQIIKKYGRIVDCIKNLVAKKEAVYYLRGNHDMSIVAADLSCFSSDGNNLRLISKSEFNQLHKGWHFEHGNDVDMLNAPDTSYDTLAGLPLGYYVTRLIATIKNKNGNFDQFLSFIENFTTGRFSENSSFAEDMITLLEIEADVTDCDKIRFADGNDKKYTVGDIKKKYSTLLYRWWKLYPDNIQNTLMTGLSETGLNWYAEILRDENKYSLIVMGHTHYIVHDDTYFNDGSWCYVPTGGCHTTYIEIDNGKAVQKQYD